MPDLFHCKCSGYLVKKTVPAMEGPLAYPQKSLRRGHGFLLLLLNHVVGDAQNVAEILDFADLGIIDEGTVVRAADVADGF